MCVTGKKMVKWFHILTTVVRSISVPKEVPCFSHVLQVLCLTLKLEVVIIQRTPNVLEPLLVYVVVKDQPVAVQCHHHNHSVLHALANLFFLLLSAVLHPQVVFHVCHHHVGHALEKLQLLQQQQLTLQQPSRSLQQQLFQLLHQL
jgi:hypothetical protein